MKGGMRKGYMSRKVAGDGKDGYRAKALVVEVSPSSARWVSSAISCKIVRGDINSPSDPRKVEGCRGEG